MTICQFYGWWTFENRKRRIREMVRRWFESYFENRAPNVDIMDASKPLVNLSKTVLEPLTYKTYSCLYSQLCMLYIYLSIRLMFLSTPGVAVGLSHLLPSISILCFSSLQQFHMFLGYSYCSIVSVVFLVIVVLRIHFL